MGLDDLDIAHPDREALVTLYKEMEFRQWLGELLEGKDEGVDDVKGGEPAPASAEEADSELDGASASSQANTREDHVILEQADFERWLERLQNAERFCFDLETTSLNYMDAEIVGVGLSLEAGEAAYIPLAHDYLDAPHQLDRKTVLASLKPLLEDPTKTKIGQNLKYDISVLANYAISVAGPFADTMLASYVLNSTATRHDMDSLALKYLGEKNHLL